VVIIHRPYGTRLDDGLHAERIGHGTSAAQEVCPTSNIRTRAVPAIEDHPLPALVAAGVPVSLATDDPGMFHTSLNREYLRCHDTFGYDRAQLAEFARAGIRASFAPAGLKRSLLAAVDHV
jgi:aminodeoxyfutalosine deaminase